MKNLHQAQKLSRAAQKSITGRGPASSSCPPTGCYDNAINNSNDRCYILSCRSVYGYMQTVNGTRKCCF
ncbi:hypothetical protein [Chryseobacterium hagamense]|uniref:hypothetical protein n=1 Tax=Chryseobacterium hagamense TaxID=395935 RepID=UPI0011BE9567|nr:hypothetical protein [Chryseobacterium hagamense]